MEGTTGKVPNFLPFFSERADKRFMIVRSWSRVASFVAGLAVIAGAGCLPNSVASRFLIPEQQSIDIRPPSELPKARIPDVPEPATVSKPMSDAEGRLISLDEAIQLSLTNGKVVRVLAGVAAVASGSTIYDPAISNTFIDQETGRFDPVLSVRNSYDRTGTPSANFDPASPVGARVDGLRTDSYNLSTQLSKTNTLGGTASIGFTDSLTGLEPGVFPLNPQNSRTAAMTLTQPLLKGAGRTANLAPIVIARLNTERSFFQFKDSLQESVRGVIEAYWALIFARTDLWARQQQVRQGQAAYDRAEARFRGKIGNAAEVAQARLALANFRTSQIAAQANAILREAALRNILGLPPADGEKLIPNTAPSFERHEFKWDELLRLAEENRPDLVELKLVIEVDQQRLAQAQNQSRPQVDLQAIYRWHGLEGITPTGAVLGSSAGRFTDLTLGIQLGLPLGLRRDRASLREQQLTVARDWANLEQGLHSAIHQVANSKRFLAQHYEQYRALKEAREAAQVNLDRQLAENSAGRAIFLNVLQAITDWGNAVSAEAQALTQYNTELANLERVTGTILETHAIHFYEERFGSISPKGRLAAPGRYPESMRPTVEQRTYDQMRVPAENVFDLRDPVKRPMADENPIEPLPPPGIKKP